MIIKRLLITLVIIIALIVSILLTIKILNSSNNKNESDTTNHLTNAISPDPSFTSKTYSAGTTNKLLTNEFAHWSPNNSSAVKSPDWDMTSGSLFSKNGSFWTGIPDSCDHVDALSKTCTNSNVFRANTKNLYDGSIDLSISLYQSADIHNPNCNNDESCWHGTHLWLRHINQFNLYYASINRADGKMVIKRKVPCGDDNSGTYFTLGTAVNHDFMPKQWNNYRASIKTNDDKSVTINLYDTDENNDIPVITATDYGGENPKWSENCNVEGHYPTSHYDPITDAGSVGVRGDYSDFLFKDFKVSRTSDK